MFGVLFLCAITFALGAVWGKFNFITSNAYTLQSPVNIESESGDGVLPKGTELYFHSAAHRQTTYFAYISVPDEVAGKYIKETGFDDYGGIKRLITKTKK